MNTQNQYFRIDKSIDYLLPRLFKWRRTIQKQTKETIDKRDLKSRSLAEWLDLVEKDWILGAKRSSLMLFPINYGTLVLNFDVPDFQQYSKQLAKIKEFDFFGRKDLGPREFKRRYNYWSQVIDFEGPFRPKNGDGVTFDVITKEFLSDCIHSVFEDFHEES